MVQLRFVKIVQFNFSFMVQFRDIFRIEAILYLVNKGNKSEVNLNAYSNYEMYK